MELLTALLSLIKQLFIPVTSYIAGKKSKENEQLKDENKKLKEYQEIDNKDISDEEVYNHDW